MNLFPHRRLALTSLLLLCSFAACMAQSFYPTQEHPKVSCSAVIEMGKGYLSGVCILKRDDSTLQGVIFNEFGISALSFTYNENKGKVKLNEVISFLDKWYIRKVIRKDIAKWMKILSEGGSAYVNERRDITYRLLPLDTNITESTDYDTEE